MPEMKPLGPDDPEYVGDYRIIGRLGAGGQGSVYLAVDAEGRRVAVKRLHPHLAGNTWARTQFVKEARAAQRVRQFCTARVMAVATDESAPYVVSQFVEGRTLLEALDTDGPYEPLELERLAVSTLNALVAIHAAGIVHCDFKPGNIIVSPHGLRVIDFGIARALETLDPAISRQIGTPAYMAPEQIQMGEVGTHTDLFSWASTMVFAATGMPPFGHGDNGAAVMHRIVTTEPELEGVPQPLRTLVELAFAKDGRERPTASQTLLALLTDTRPHAEQTRADPPNHSPAAPTVTDRPKWRRTIAVSASAILLMVASVGAAVLLTDNERPVVPDRPKTWPLKMGEKVGSSGDGRGSISGPGEKDRYEFDFLHSGALNAVQFVALGTNKNRKPLYQPSLSFTLRDEHGQPVGQPYPNQFSDTTLKIDKPGRYQLEVTGTASVKNYSFLLQETAVHKLIVKASERLGGGHPDPWVGTLDHPGEEHEFTFRTPLLTTRLRFAVHGSCERSKIHWRLASNESGPQDGDFCDLGDQSFPVEAGGDQWTLTLATSSGNVSAVTNYDFSVELAFDLK
ncbi:serine/threonine protein kinase [Actinomadura graeca]|uniref:Serine/threonine protein kinase n=1 Tax=Actinomadura graeca TaxID=2750812 RepID=A0ABX8QTA2_9ACTN|nr:serine/threonine-protein kinase [Actinomadura graeca]QXJ20033.1 serine/threonine protein kinase [Actinomadura graeca]